MASRKEEKEQKRQERLAAQNQAELDAKRKRTYGIVAGAVLVLGVIAATIFIVAAGGGDDGSSTPGAKPEAEYPTPVAVPAQQESDLFAAAKKAGCVLKNPPIAGSNHVESSKALEFSTNPPTSGDHDAQSQPDGVYGAYPAPRHTVHALEGGRTQIQYKPTIPQKQIDQLGGIYEDDSLYLLMYPNPTMQYDIAVSAWGHMAGCKKVDAATYDVVRAFIQRYRDQAPEPAASHQVAAGQPGWPGPLPPLHTDGATPGS